MTCSIDGCSKRAEKRGWCGMHYRRFQRHGDPLYVSPARTHKRCRDCGEVKPLSDFYRNEKAQSWTSRCKPCYGIANEARRQANRPADLASKRRRYQANREQMLAQFRARYWADPEAARAAARRGYEKHRDERLAANYERLRTDPAAKVRLREAQRRNNQKRRAAQRAVASIDVSASVLAARVAYWGDRCWICHEAWSEIDHVKPISKGGSHLPCNLRPICGPCNKRKSAKWPVLTGSRIPLDEAVAALDLVAVGPFDEVQFRRQLRRVA